MTTAPDAEATTEPDPIAQAITALTAAARQTRVRGAGTESESVEPVDFAEIACHVITTVAANVGGVETLLAGRPGSWEADYVRQIVASTAPEDELWRWRTEPVRLHLDVAGTFDDFGLYELAEEELRAAAARTVGESVSDAELERAESLLEAIDRLREQDMNAYAQAYAATVRQVLTERGIEVDVEVIRTPDFQAPAEPWDALTDELHAIARERTPLPATGQAPDWSTGSPVDAVRAAGRTYTARTEKEAR
ncbi:hypothetical protein [Georgenia daeguensis]|uniref:DUF4303 domain-containing protein n=1 Tax=Georgenia daeguensis TaxID=908355 RepID=A0ABP8EZ63_9MICO